MPTHARMFLTTLAMTAMQHASKLVRHEEYRTQIAIEILCRTNIIKCLDLSMTKPKVEGLGVKWVNGTGKKT